MCAAAEAQGIPGNEGVPRTYRATERVFDNHPATSSAADASLPRHTAPLNRSISNMSPDRKDTTMTMGDRIKTRQQLLDEQTDANARATHGDDRHDESARPHQTHDSTAEHVNQDGAEVQGGVDAVRQELEQLRQRMAVIKQEATVEVDRNWVSPWRTPAMFDLKVKTRLTSHQEYRSLQDRVRDAMASLPAESDTVTQARPAK
jgi:dynactin complex subunit